jgi:hypothetical protein
MSDDAHSGSGTEQFECVVCGSEQHDGNGWIFPTEDTKVVDIAPDGLERELIEDSRALCSLDCKDQFEQSDEWSTGTATEHEGGDE